MNHGGEFLTIAIRFFHGCTRQIGLVTLLMALAATGGCDPVRTTNQTVSIKIFDRETKTAVDGIIVKMKRAWSPSFLISRLRKGATHKKELGKSAMDTRNIRFGRRCSHQSRGYGT